MKAPYSMEDLCCGCGQRRGLHRWRDEACPHGTSYWEGTEFESQSDLEPEPKPQTHPDPAAYWRARTLAAEAEVANLTNALWKACGDAAEMARALIESQSSTAGD